MKKFSLLVFVLLWCVDAVAQFSANFRYDKQAGAVYCYIYNQTRYQTPIQLVAMDIYGRTCSWNCTLNPNSTVSIGPNNGWIWQSNETITVYYQYYGQSKSLSWRYVPTKSNPSFTGKHCNGTVGCDCPGFEPKTDGKVWENSVCKHCGHLRTYHKF